MRSFHDTFIDIRRTLGGDRPSWAPVTRSTSYVHNSENEFESSGPEAVTALVSICEQRGTSMSNVEANGGLAFPAQISADD